MIDRYRRQRALRLASIVALAWTLEARAQSVTIDGPPPPVAPEVITRNAAGQATIRPLS